MKKFLKSLFAVFLSMAVCLFPAFGCGNNADENGDDEKESQSTNEQTDWDAAYVLEGSAIKSITAYGKKQIELIIPEKVNGVTVTEIADNAFYGHDSFKSITLPNTVTRIGESAFYQCKMLESVVIPNGVTKIEKKTFYDCEKLSSAVLGTGVTCIEEDAFSGCVSLAEINIPSSLVSIGKQAFFSCSSLKGVAIGDGVSVIGENAFSACYSLGSVTIGKNVEKIEAGAFSACFRLVEVINESEKIQISLDSEDNGQIALNALTVHSGESKIKTSEEFEFVEGDDGVNYLFGYYGTASSLTLPADFEGGEYKINCYAFRGNKNLTVLTVGQKVSAIGKGAFLYCSSLTSVSFEDASGVWFAAESFSAESGTIIGFSSEADNFSQNAALISRTAKKSGYGESYILKKKSV